MERIIRFDENLDLFKNIVILYKDENDNTYIGSSSHNEEGEENRKNYIVLYKDALPKDKNYLMGWNYLDDNSEKIYLVYNEHSEVAVDDFLAAHNINKTWRDINYYVVDGITDINEKLNNHELETNEIRAYVTLK